VRPLHLIHAGASRLSGRRHWRPRSADLTARLIVRTANNLTADIKSRIIQLAQSVLAVPAQVERIMELFGESSCVRCPGGSRNSFTAKTVPVPEQSESGAGRLAALRRWG